LICTALRVIAGTKVPSTRTRS